LKEEPRFLLVRPNIPAKVRNAETTASRRKAPEVDFCFVDCGYDGPQVVSNSLEVKEASCPGRLSYAPSMLTKGAPMQSLIFVFQKNLYFKADAP
jgi:hypothetical protein